MNPISLMNDTEVEIELDAMVDLLVDDRRFLNLLRLAQTRQAMRINNLYGHKAQIATPPETKKRRLT